MDNINSKTFKPENYWNEFEYSKLKLLLHPEKVQSVFSLLKHEKSFDEFPPVSIELHLTDRCNLRCSWCTDKLLRSRASDCSVEKIKKLFDYCRKNDVGVTLEGGGEPLIHPDFAEIVLYGSKIGLDMGLISNGTINLSSLIVHFKWVRISVDAASESEYLIEKGVDKYNIVMENLKNYSRTRKPETTHLGIGYVLTSRNMSNLENLMTYLNSIYIDYAYLRPVEEAAEITPKIQALLEIKKLALAFNDKNRMQMLININERLIKSNDSLPCVAHSLSCIIHANGDVVLCEKRRHDKVIFGNIRDNSFEEIWNSQARKIASQKLLVPESQHGCDVCRITSFNRAFCDLNKIHTRNFI
ncbi:MAG: radical SAM protein [Candidatus Riflebacteria bacterium]|nr:radical SAM protein [Candidatus Riflebacteria bacterium]